MSVAVNRSARRIHLKAVRQLLHEGRHPFPMGRLLCAVPRAEKPMAHPPATGQPPASEELPGCPESKYIMPVHRPLSAAPAQAGAADEKSLMAEFSITYNGRYYACGAYRYDHLADAVNAARLRQSNPALKNPAYAAGLAQAPEMPDQKQRQTMADLAITLDQGVYHLGPYCYDRLADAVNYARLPARARRLH